MNTSKRPDFDSALVHNFASFSDENNVAYNRNHLKRKSRKQSSYVESNVADLNEIDVGYKKAVIRHGVQVNVKRHKDPNEKTFMCVICQKRFDLMRGLTKHFTHSHKMPSKCSICHGRCSSHKQLVEHMLLHSTERVSSDKNSHVKKTGRDKISHGKENLFSCEFCPRMFIREKCLNNHLNIHTKEALVCKFCEKKFLFNARLLKHLQEVHSISDSILGNKVSENTSQTPCNKSGDLQMDQSRLLQPEENSCVLCNDNFSTSYELGLHLIQHAEEYEKLCAANSSSLDDSDVEIIVD